MNKIAITDVTVKQSCKANGYTLSFREKIELVKLLDKLNVDVIELNAIDNIKIDSLLIKSVASAVSEPIIAVPVGLSTDSVDTVWTALSSAKKARLQVQVPVSAVGMEYIAGKKPAAMLETVAALVKKCASFCETEFIAEDATRADSRFLADVINAAIENGAKIVTLCDTAGTSLPGEFAAFAAQVKADVPALSGVTLGVSCANSLSLADASVIAALSMGVAEIKTAAYGSASASLANVISIISSKFDALDCCCNVKTTQIKRIIDQINWMCETNRSKNSPFDNGVQNDSGIYLNEHDDIAAVTKAVVTLGYELSDEDNAKVYEAFQKIAARKQTVGIKELDAIVATAALQVPPTYQLENYVVNIGNTISATANINMLKNGVELKGVSLGDGPIDAAFLAIEQIVGHHFELDDFQIQAVTEGREAMGEAVVKLRSSGKLYSGRGISTDIVGASINAYINALNKIVYEESI